MHQKYIVICPARFLRRYVPTVTDERDGRFSEILKHVPVAYGKDLRMHKALINALNRAKICPMFKFAITASHGDPSDSSNEAIIGLYPQSGVPRASKGLSGKILSPASDWSRVELCIECKADADSVDPFNDSNNAEAHSAYGRKGLLDHVLSCVESILKRQQRTCVFMVLILGNYCRLARFDRSGGIVTERFNYKTDDSSLIEFLWRYARLGPAERGHDDSAEQIAPSSAVGKRMQARVLKSKDLSKPDDYIRRTFAESLDARWSWWKLRVDDNAQGPRFFLVGKPDFQAPGVAGRGTRGYVALDAGDINGPFYYLKDAWRVVGRDVDKEGKILQTLNEKGVSYIPTLECHGDVAASLPRQTKKRFQETKTDRLWDDMHKTEEQPEVRPVTHHRHYRIVVKEVGLPMSEFSNARQLVFAIWCCIYAHFEAYKANVIHRDISAGNVLLYFDAKDGQWVGLLNDWELSMSTKCDRPQVGRLNRKGTWAYMSVRALDNPNKTITVQDELESYFNVLLYFAVRFLPHNCPDVGAFVEEYFDDYRSYHAGRYTCGPYKRSCMRMGSLHLPVEARDGIPGGKLVFLDFHKRPNETVVLSHPLNAVLEQILSWLAGAYYSRPPSTNAETLRSQETQAPYPCDEEELDFSEYIGNLDQSSESEDAGKVSAAAVRVESQEQECKAAEALADKLRTHQPILNMLKRHLQNRDRWPANDKQYDQLHRKGDKPEANIELPAVGLPKQEDGSSRKRTSEEVEQLADQEQPKRQKFRRSHRDTSTRRARPNRRKQSAIA